MLKGAWPDRTVLWQYRQQGSGAQKATMRISAAVHWLTPALIPWMISGSLAWGASGLKSIPTQHCLPLVGGLPQNTVKDFFEFWTSELCDFQDYYDFCEFVRNWCYKDWVTNIYRYWVLCVSLVGFPVSDTWQHRAWWKSGPLMACPHGFRCVVWYISPLCAGDVMTWSTGN
jgi:hypothetical protein